MRRVTTSMPLCGVDDDRDGLDRRQTRDRRADQIRRAGRVDDVDALAQMIGVQNRREDRVLVLLLLLLEIAKSWCRRRRTPLRLTVPLAKQHGIDQRRLPAPAVAGNQNVANIRGGVTGHGGTPER